MTCKPELAMKKILAREDHFVRGGSPKEVARELASRLGGTGREYEWEKEVKTAIAAGTFIPTQRGGEFGHRTLRRSERPDSDVTSSSVHGDSLVVTA